jgi:hypothetical protein
MSTPDIRVEKGHAEPEEVAAITAILLARAAAAPGGSPGPPSAAQGRLAPAGARGRVPRAAQLARIAAPLRRT